MRAAGFVVEKGREGVLRVLESWFGSWVISNWS
jgi:hypothetical protein